MNFALKSNDIMQLFKNTVQCFIKLKCWNIMKINSITSFLQNILKNSVYTPVPGEKERLREVF